MQNRYLGCVISARPNFYDAGKKYAATTTVQPAHYKFIYLGKYQSNCFFVNSYSV